MAGGVAVLPATGDLVADRYRLVRELGRGGMGVVFEAENVTVGSKVAVKFLLPDSVDQQDLVRRFRREARATACIPHPNVVYVFDLGLSGESKLPFIAMELLHGEPLSNVLRLEGPLSSAAAAAIGAQMLDALAAAHERGVIHRDLKPSNVFLVGPRQSHVKLLDFGISKFLPDSDQLTKLGSVMGTPAYMPPEQAMGLPVDHRVDLYGTAAVLYEALTGRPPYDDEAPIAVIARMLGGTAPPPIRQLRPEIDIALAGVIEQALERRPELRWQSAIRMREALLDAAPVPGLEIPAQQAFAKPRVTTRLTLTDSAILSAPSIAPPLDPPSAAEAVATTPRTRLPPPRRPIDRLRIRRAPLIALVAVPLAIGIGVLVGSAGSAAPPPAVRPMARIVANLAPPPPDFAPPPAPFGRRAPRVADEPDAVFTEPVAPAAASVRPRATGDGRAPRRRPYSVRERTTRLNTKVLEPNPFR